MNLVVSIFYLLALVPQFTKGRKNVVFIVVDDLRPQIAAYYGKFFPSNPHDFVSTPNLDYMASRSLLLKRSYVQYALCSPSRTSFLTGRRPDTTHVYDLKTKFRDVGGNFTTIPQFFKMHGYETISIGKIFHHPKADPASWNEDYYVHPSDLESGKNNSWKGITDNEMEHNPLRDQRVAKQAILTLQKVALKKKPFFIAVGFHKPHLPFVCPWSFLNKYNLSSLKQPSNQFAPDKITELSWKTSSELRNFRDIKRFKFFTGKMNTTLPRNKVLQLRRAYYACVSYIDDLVGSILKELTNLGLDDKTIVSFIGDHGYKLGEHGAWNKHTNFDLDTHAPMMIRIPGLTDTGIVTEQITEFVDLFPTLVEAAGLGYLPSCPKNSSLIQTCHEGTSLMPLIRDPNSPVKVAAFTQYKGQDSMGYSVTTDRFRYTEWVRFQYEPIYKPDWNTLLGIELYEHLVDPEENSNRAGRTSLSVVQRELQMLLHNGWRRSNGKMRSSSFRSLSQRDIFTEEYTILPFTIRTVVQQLHIVNILIYAVLFLFLIFFCKRRKNICNKFTVV